MTPTQRLRWFRRKLWELRPGNTPRDPLQRARFLMWDYPFTQGGKLVVAFFFFSAVLCGFTLDLPVYHISVSIFSLTLLAGFFGGLLRWGDYEITSRLDERVFVGEPLRGEFAVRNTGWCPAWDVQLACMPLPRGWAATIEPAIVPSLPKSGEARFQISMVPDRRGEYQLCEVRSFTVFPFYLFRNELCRVAVGRVLVLPRWHELHTINWPPSNAPAGQAAGTGTFGSAGVSPEFLGNREYAPGDSPRHIDFRSWARIGKPVAKEFQRDETPAVSVFLDTSVISGRRPSKNELLAFESAVVLSAAITDRIVSDQLLLELFVAGKQSVRDTTGRGWRSELRFDVLDTLAAINPTAVKKFADTASQILSEFAAATRVICLFFDWSAEQAAFVRQLVDRAAAVKVIIVRSQPTTLPIADDGAWGSINQIAPAAILSGQVTAI